MNTIYHRVTQSLTEMIFYLTFYEIKLCETLCYSVVNPKPLQ